MSAVLGIEQRLASPPNGAFPLTEVFERLRSAQSEDPYPTLERRLAWLDLLRALLLYRREELVAAISDDFGNRSRHETLMAEVYLPVEAISYTRKRLRGWMKPQRRRVGLPFLPARASVLRQPLGVVGIISPWNYPLQLALMPMVGALAAGNRVMLKPSELTPSTSALLAEVLPATLGEDVVAVATGDDRVGARFAALPFDHLFFTGSTRVGRLVGQAAAKNLTPVTLELGGKSPAIVQRDYPLSHAAQRIVAGKLFNAGQTCIAPDYVLAPRDLLESLALEITLAATCSYPSLASNPDYTSIITEAHYRRLVIMVDDARSKGARIWEINPQGESLDPASRKLAPTLVLYVTEDMEVMQEEIFGPLLPLVPYDSLDDAIHYVNQRPQPLCLYYFDKSQRRVDHLTQATSSGGVTVNDTMFHFAQEDLPFGGVGPSGMGAYHGEASFLAFSHAKSIFHQAPINGARLFSPPYGKLTDRLLSLLIR